MDQFLRDLKHGARMLLRRPAFAAVAVVSLALGISLNTTLFSVVNAVLLRETPVHAPDRLLEIYSSASDEMPQLTTSFPEFQSIRDGVPALAGAAAHAFVRGILTSGDQPVLVTGEAVTSNYFELLGIPARGPDRSRAVASGRPAAWRTPRHSDAGCAPALRGARGAGCTAFVTNDHDLSRMPGLRILQIKAYVAGGRS